MSAAEDGLVATRITVRFGGLVALNDVSLEAPRRRITGLIGPNGAGKTTMFNVCSGFLKPDSGIVSLEGHDITSKGAADRARLGLGRTFQRMELFRSLTVRENIELAADALHIGDDPFTQLGILKAGRRVRSKVREATDELLDWVGLTDVADVPAGALSSGQGRLLELARAVAHRPRIVLLDEPSSGLDATESRAFGQHLQRLVQERDIGILMVDTT
jgi:ABC-type branched-subunit amino acid transport system ATPase component